MRITFVGNQLPLVEAGNLRDDYPTAITSVDVIHYESLNTSLTPSGRQMDLETSYQH